MVYQGEEDQRSEIVCVKFALANIRSSGWSFTTPATNHHAFIVH